MYRVLIETPEGTEEYLVPAESKRQAYKKSLCLVLGVRVLSRTVKEIY